mgnify:CR=1 FL=1
MPLKKIYSLEDDLSVINIIEEALILAGFSVRSFSDYRLFFDEIKKEKPDLILLDLSLPLISGEEVLKYIKGNLIMHNIPIIILSGRVSESDVVNCLNFGADDFMKKPFSVLELISRINAVLRRFGIRDNILFDNIEILLDDRIVKIDNNLVELTNKEFDLLLYLIERVDKIVTKEELVKMFWENNVSNSRSMDMHIMALRTKVFSKTKLEIQTILKIGYKLKSKE